MYSKILVSCLVHLIFALSVEGVSIILNPANIVVGSTDKPVTKFEVQCSNSGSNDIKKIYVLKILRRKNDEQDFIGFAIITDVDQAAKDVSMPLDIQAKSNVTGNLDLTSGTLTLTINTQGMSCSDDAEFQCLLSYLDTRNTAQLSHDSKNLTVDSAPSDFRITDALYVDKGIMLQLTNDSRLTVGTRITYRCSANIGSDSTLAIAWERSSMLEASTDFTVYTPTVSTDIVQDQAVQGSCSYTRTSTMYYNMTSMDDDGILFRCKVRVYIGNQWYEPTSMPRRTFAIPTSSESSAVTTGGQEVRTTSASSAVKIEGSNVSISEVLAIVLGVLFGVSVILILILSICLHRYRKLTEELQCQLQSDYLNAYDRLNRTVGHSEPYNMLERDNSDRRVPNENVNMEHDAL